MSKWIKVNAYTRMDQAMLRKDLLLKNDIEAFVVNEQDSAFLLGEIEIYVPAEEAENARELLQQFEGWTRINVFNRLKPVERLKAILEDNDFKTFFMRKQDEESQLINFELYVPNEQAKAAKNLLNNLMGWEKILYMEKSHQAAIRVDILEENGIPTLITKDRNKKGQIIGVKLFVDESLSEEALKLLSEHKGWEKLREYNNEEAYKKHIQILESNEIPVWEDHTRDVMAIYVPSGKQTKADDLIQIHTEWVPVKSYERATQANLDKDFLEKNGIEAFVLNQRDSVFLLGTVNLYVEENSIEEAQKLLENQ